MVLLVSPFTHLAGHYWSYTRDFAVALKTTGTRAEVFASSSPEQPGFGEPFLIWRACCKWTQKIFATDIRNRSWNQSYDRPIRNLEFFCCLRKALKTQEKFHIHCIEAQHRLLLKSVLATGRTFSLLCVGAPSEYAKKHIGQVYKNAFATGRFKIIVETESVLSEWSDFAGQNVVHIPVAISPRSDRILSKKDSRRLLGLPENAFICLFFGTHREGKDYNTCIEAAKLCKCQPFLLFAGPQISANDPDILLKQHNYPNSVSWKRFFLEPDAAQLFDSADVVMLPYSEGYEKGSSVLLEACKFGKPVIASNTGHLKKFVASHETGKLYPPGDALSLSKIIDEMSAISQTELSKLKSSILRAVSTYSWSQLAKNYLAVFESMKTKSSKSKSLF